MTEAVQDRYFGVNRIVLERSFGKRLEECMAAKGGLLSLVWWLDNLDFVEGLQPLVDDISRLYTFFDMSLPKVAKEALSRPEEIREEEIGTLLGYCCPKCGKALSAMAHRNQKICGCGERYKLTYLVVYKKIRALNIVPVPEAVLAWVAWDNFALAYKKAYLALQKVFRTVADSYGLPRAFEIFNTPDFKDKLDSTFLYFEPGDIRLSKEEREMLMFLVRGNLAEIGLSDAERLIDAGMDVCKYGTLFARLFCSGAEVQYYEARMKYSALYNRLNERIRAATAMTRQEREKKISIRTEQLSEAQFYPCAVLPKPFWSSGKLAKDLVFKPMEKGKLPIFTDEENVAMNCWVAPSGSGKTTFMGSVVYHCVDWAKEYIFNVLSDEKNGLSLSCLPLFPCEGHTNELLKVLREAGVEPKPIPCLNLAFLRPGEEEKCFSKNRMQAHPPTIYDRIVEVDDPHSFGFEFWTGGKATVESKGVVGNRGVLNILEEFAHNLGYKRLCGLINVRNMLRQEEDRTKYSGASERVKKTKIDVAIGATLFEKFMMFRQESKFPSGRVSIDELARFAPMMHTKGGADTFEAAATLNEEVKAMRGCNLSFDTATQSWNEIQPESKKEKFNVFFRELPKSTDKSHSQRFLVLGDLDLKAGESELITYLMENKIIPKNLHLWFWWNKETGDVQLIRPLPPPFMLNQPEKTNMEVFKAYERFSGEKVLLDSWDEVPRLKYENTEYEKFDWDRPVR